MENVFTLLTSEDKDDIRASVKAIIIQQIKNDFENYDCYILDPHEIEDMVQEVVEEAKDEVRNMYKEILIKQMEEKLSKLMD